MPNYWLVKQEPEGYPFSQLQKDKTTSWDGVRNYQARNNLKAMKKGDSVLYYHSGDEKAVVGLAEVSKAAYADPTTKEEGWVSVELKAVRALKTPVTLVQIKADKQLAQMVLVKHSRLSVMPVTQEEFEKILQWK